MNLREASTFLIWCGFKTIDGEPFTDQEFEKFKEAHAVSVSKSGMLFIDPKDYEYKKGRPFR